MNLILFSFMFTCLFSLITSDEIIIICDNEIRLRFYETQINCIIKKCVASYTDHIIYEKKPHETASWYNNILKIEFRESSMPHIPDKLFTQMPSTHELFISSVGIESLHPAELIDGKNLLTLNMSNNKITELIPGVFKNVPRISDIDFSNNKIGELKNGVFAMANKLTSINLSKNPIKILNPNLFADVDQLEHIYLEAIQLETISSTIFANCSKLKTIKLGNNNLKTIDCKMFQHIEHLETLDLSWNKLKTFDSTCLKQINLNFIISHNDLGSLFVHNWNSLDASSNGITDINLLDNFSYTMHELKLGGNKIDNSIEILHKFTDLEYLDLSDSEIGDLHESTLKNLPNLKELHLRNCQLGHLVRFGIFSRLQNLIVFDISYNGLYDDDINFNAFYPYLKNLEEFYIDGNNFYSINDITIEIFPQLEKIGLSYNNLLCLDITNLLLNFKSNNIELIKESILNKTDVSHVDGVECMHEDEQQYFQTKQIGHNSIYYFVWDAVIIVGVMCVCLIGYKFYGHTIKNNNNFTPNRFANSDTTTNSVVDINMI